MTERDRFTHLHENFDIEDPAFADEFEEVLEHLVNRCPVARSEVGRGYHVFNRYEDVRRCGADWRTFSSTDGWMLNPPEGNLPILPEDLDPPYHTAWRRVLNPFFNPRSVAAIEDASRGYAGELIDVFADAGHCEFVADFAAQLPGLILFRHIIPVPVDDLPELFQHVDTYSFGAEEDRAPAFAEVYAYLQRLLEIRRDATPQNDLLDVLLAGVDRDGEACPFEDKVHTLLDLVFGGLATTTHAIAGAIYELASRAEVRRELVADPRSMKAAVDESVRLHAPVVAVARSVRADCVVRDTELQAGDRVALNFAAASRDPEQFSRPRDFDLHREKTVHTAFGIGPHRCIGEHLARMEIRVSIEEFLRRIPDFEVSPGTRPLFESGQLRTMKRLELRW